MQGPRRCVAEARFLLPLGRAPLARSRVGAARRRATCAPLACRHDACGHNISELASGIESPSTC
eukprot:scaffold518_cov388-Prasinococcus_capsulatus_cf.AAC.32